MAVTEHIGNRKASGAGIGHATAAALTQAIPTPDEDVRGYMQQALLPVLGPAIEGLLHHVHESGELQRMLKEKAEAESAAAKADRVQREGTDRPQREGRADGKSSEKHGKGDRERDRADSGNPRRPSVDKGGHHIGRRPSAQNKEMKRQSTAETHTPEVEEDEQPQFDPLIWLSEQLRQHAAGRTDQYRQQISERITQKLQEQEAAQPEDSLDRDSNPQGSPPPSAK
eukprot:TRINITY_DN124649_c0_g1_i1.p1 TRINITY_DN124649_c0_g1~~TRINITY_DN124649_c0_g1_i1.p1  ORF type:complete len:227 (+),score=59.75 TRINITY_DN124649_c0_g1_i1:76-756(+)